MIRKAFVIAIIIAIFVAYVPSPATASPPLPDYVPMEISPEIRGREAGPEYIVAPPDEVEGAAHGPAAGDLAPADLEDCIIETKIWLQPDIQNWEFRLQEFDLVHESDFSQLWVQRDLSWPVCDPNDPSCVPDPRETPIVTCEQAAYMAGQFDNIRLVETDFFGPADFHDGSNSLLEQWGYVPPNYYLDGDGRQVILVSNIIDANYYDPEYPYYIAGFYLRQYETYFDRNVVYVDAYDWVERTGNEGEHPYLYEGVLAREYQRLLHDDYDAREKEWVNEGLAMFAQHLTGYTHEDDQYSAFIEHPENSLVAWGDQGDTEIDADRGITYLFFMYLWEKHGPELIQSVFLNQEEQGITSVNSSLDALGIDRDFTDIYHDFSVAALIDSARKDFRHGFESLDVNVNIGTPDEPNLEAFDTPGAPPWGTDYIWIQGDPDEMEKLYFDGSDESIFSTPWTSVEDTPGNPVLWSGSGDLVDNWAIFEATGGGMLTMDARWDLQGDPDPEEGNWDFAFVQVSTDGGHTWTSLENEWTTWDAADGAHPKVLENLPGLTGYQGWVPLSFDLSPHAGQDILIGLRLVTDWSTHYGGWWVDNIAVRGTLISDGTDASIFKDITEVVPIDNDFHVTLVGIQFRSKGNKYRVHTIKLDDLTESGEFKLKHVLRWCHEAVMLVTYEAPEDFEGYADYSYSFGDDHPHDSWPDGNDDHQDEIGLDLGNHDDGSRKD
jgi:hypothetical protein